jgi:hypothetical protein
MTDRTEPTENATTANPLNADSSAETVNVVPANAENSSIDGAKADTSSTEVSSEASPVMPGANFLSDGDRERIARLTSSNDARFKSDVQNQAVLERAKRWFRALFMRADHGRWRVSKSKALAYLTAGAAMVAFWNYWPRPHLENAFDTPAITLGSGAPGSASSSQSNSSATGPTTGPRTDLGITAPPKLPNMGLKTRPTEAILAAPPSVEPPAMDSSFSAPAETYSQPVTVPNMTSFQPQMLEPSYSPTLNAGVPGVSSNPTSSSSQAQYRVAPAPMALIKSEPIRARAPVPLIQRPATRSYGAEPSSLVNSASRPQAEPTALVSATGRPQPEPSSLVNVSGSSKPEPLQISGLERQAQDPQRGNQVPLEVSVNRAGTNQTPSEPAPLMMGREQGVSAQPSFGQAGVLVDVQNRRDTFSSQSSAPTTVEVRTESRATSTAPVGILFDRSNSPTTQISSASSTESSGSSQTKPAASPYLPGARVAAKLVTGLIVLAGREAPVVIALEDGGIAFGKASLNEANRVQIAVLEVVRNGISSSVNGSGLALDGFPGLLGQGREDGADVVSKLWNATLSGVSSYVQGLTNANTTTYGQGVTTISQPGADLGWSVLGNLAQAFLTPPAQQQTVKYVELKPDTPFQVLFLPVR